LSVDRADARLDADWQAPPGVVAFTTLRHGAGISSAPYDHFNLGARCGDDADAVAHNRDELVARFALPARPHWLRQVHGAVVALEPGFEEPVADAAVTHMPGTVLAVLTADCLPVVFASDDGSEIAVAHAGWRGLADGVLEATLTAMHTPRARTVAWLGPAAGPLAYEIGQEVFDAFVSRDADAASAFAATRPGHWRVDLYALARRQLTVAGVTRVDGGGLCTISDPQRFFSHRRDQRSGRMATIVYIEKTGAGSR
jgi:YfiH family protein